MKSKRKLSSKQIVIKTATVGLLLNMLAFPAASAMAEAVNKPVTTEAGTKAPVKTPAKTEVAKIPTVDSLGLKLKSAVLIEPTTGKSYYL